MASIVDDKGYNQIYKKTKAVLCRIERRSDYIIGKMNLTKKLNILEIGCGTGELSFLIASKTHQDVLGIDICGPFIEKAKNKYSLPNLSFKILDFKDFLLPITPEFLISPSIIIGDIAEKIPFINKLAQSIYISANKA